LYSGDRTALFRANLDGSGRVNLVPAVNQVDDVELDLINNKVYWSEGAFGVNAIYRANLDGTGKQTLIDVGSAGGMEGLALDPSAGKLYFTFNGPSDSIRSMNLDGSGLTTLYTLPSGSSDPFDIEIDPGAGLLYWDNPPDNQIFKSDLAGGTRELIATVPGLANGIHVDPVDQKIYFGVAGVGVESVNTDGTGFEFVATARTYNYSEVLRLSSAVPDGGNTGLMTFGTVALMGWLQRKRMH
jgi:hypothetical protein